MQNDSITLVTSKRKWFSVDLKELWRYRDLAILFVKRDLKNSYKQTVLGPLWILINPFLSTTVFTVIFGVIANISTDGVPQFLFYMAGNILWTFFSNCLSRGTGTFLGNAHLFGKVYFPRLIMPIAGVMYYGLTFFIQFVVFLILVLIYMFTGSAVHINAVAILLPVLLLQTASLGIGTGLIISSVTTKYRDLNVLVGFGVSLWMYITPVVYPVSQIPDFLGWLAYANPVAPIMETFRYAFLGSGSFNPLYWGFSLCVTAVVLLFGVLVFNRVEKNFIDTV
ncbi:MAG: ABC transporter permease [Ruminococcus sp.]|nr:ABC transporter permease [Ruminococcus sp.]MEE0857254.1 ABC transporter permease [Ruminococcus sp.]MEE1171186.1 ABC transporter permease [Ruminococcus sp.]